MSDSNGDDSSYEFIRKDELWSKHSLKNGFKQEKITFAKNAFAKAVEILAEAEPVTRET